MVAHIRMQCIDWHAEDMQLEDDDESGEEHYVVKAFGRTADGRSASLNLVGWTPFFYVKIQGDREAFAIRQQLARGLTARHQPAVLGVQVLKRKSFWGFTDDADFLFARVKFRTLAAFRQGARVLRKHGRALFESNIEPHIRLLHYANVDPTGWIEADANPSDILPTHCHQDLECHWKALRPHDAKAKIAPFVVASFDLECTSSHGDFPVAQKDYRKTAYELIQWSADASIRQLPPPALKEHLRRIFAEDVFGTGAGAGAAGGAVSRVFAKQPGEVPRALAALERHLDDVVAVLTGNISYETDDDDDDAAAANTTTLHRLTSILGTFEGDGQWRGVLPAPQGDPIIQIGTTVHRYGDAACTYRNVITLGTCEPIDGAEVVACRSERELLLAWARLVRSQDPDIVTGYNIFGFDMAYVYHRALELGIEDEVCRIGRIQDRVCKYEEKELSSSALGDNLLKMIRMDGRVLIDVMKVVQRDHRLDSYRLDAVAEHFTGEKKHDITPNDIFRLQKQSAADRRTIAEYCIQDCALCNRLIIKLEILANNIGMSNVCAVPLSYIFMRGQGVKIFSLVARECMRDRRLVPTLYVDDAAASVDEAGYEGAVVLEPKSGIYIDDPISVFDYASLYPSSMISENLSHDSIVLEAKYDNLPGVEYVDISYDLYDAAKAKAGVKTVRFAQMRGENAKSTIPRILAQLLEQRKEARRQMALKRTAGGVVGHLVPGGGAIRDEEGRVHALEPGCDVRDAYDPFQKAVLDGLQLAYKVTANSLYGQCGARTSPIYLKDIAACTTATGRSMIMKAKHFLEQNYDAECIYGDTDSIFVRFRNAGRPRGHSAIAGNIALSKQIAGAIKAILKKPHDLEYEKTFWPFVLFSKKRYCANKYENDDVRYSMSSMGIVLKRRDNAQIVKRIYGGIIDIILNEQDIPKSIEFLRTNLQALVDGKFPLEELVITKSLRSQYKDPARIAHKVLAERMGERDIGTKPQVNDRIPYVYIRLPPPPAGGRKKPAAPVLQGDRIEHPDFIRARSLKPDYEFYISNQIMKPVLQIYALVLEQLRGFNKGAHYYDSVFRKLLVEKKGDRKKARDRYNDLREAEVRKLLFEPVLQKLRNREARNSEITDYFFKANSRV